MKNAYQKYKSTQVISASKEKLLLMMYEGAIKFTKLAIKAADEKNVPERCNNIGRAFDIVLELNNTLDHKVGGKIAMDLEQLYMFITDQFTKANLTGDSKPLKDSLKILETLYDGWKVAVEKLKSETSRITNKPKEGMMDRIISLLEQKNHYLEKFYSTNEAALEQFQVGIFDSLESFYQTREKILEIIRYIDSEIGSENTELMSPTDRALAAENMKIKDQYVEKILTQDLEILACIDSAKSSIIRELQDVKKARKAVSGYKSHKQNPNQRLDEEA
jgi:flagellar protein FliS